MADPVTRVASPEPGESNTSPDSRPVLVIVESPTKARTLSRILGRGYQVEATKGHVRTLIKVTRAGNSFIPHYQTMPEKLPLIARLTGMAQAASRIVLATDDDREGEAIAADLVVLLSVTSLSAHTPVERVVFHEITETAVVSAFASPRSIDSNLVESQRARQILDKEIGVHLSRALANQVANYRFNMKYGSGRVQAPALLLVVDRELQRRSFTPASYGTLDVELPAGDVAHLRELNGQRLAVDGSDFDAAGQVVPGRHVLAYAQAANYAAVLPGASLTVRSTTVTQRKESPKSPFITATLQQAASTYLGFSPEETMSHAQKLYELGLISYMRTDSAALSAAALAACDSEIVRVGQTPVRRLSVSSSHAQNAHEAIRPAIDSSGAFISPQAANLMVSATRGQELFDLIWRRTVASQMADCVRALKTTTLDGAAGPDALTFVANSSAIVSDGFRAVWSTGEPAAQTGSSFAAEQQVAVLSAQAHSLTTSPPNRFSEAGLIKEMVKLGIGRPSTYAPTLKRLLEHNFARRGNGRTLIPTTRGVLAAMALRGLPVSQAGSSVANYQFTAGMEAGLDQVANGAQSMAAFLGSVFGAPSGPGLLLDLLGWSTSSASFRDFLLGTFPCGNSAPAATSCMPGDVYLRAGTGKRFDYAECRACDSRCALPESYTFGDTPDSDVALWVHTRTNRLLGVHANAELWACFGDTGGYLEARGPGDRRETWPLEEDPNVVTFESAVVLVERPRVPRLLGFSAAAGFPVWVRSGKEGLVVEAGPDASKPFARSRRANSSRRTVVTPLPEGLNDAVTLDDVSGLVDQLLSESFPGEQFESTATPLEEGAPEHAAAVTVESIAEYLRVSPDSPAKVIARALGCDKKSVNSVLFNTPAVFAKNEEVPPLWRVVGEVFAGQFSGEGVTSEELSAAAATAVEPASGSAVTVESIADYLKGCPDSSAKVVAKALGCDKKSVNSLLHGTPAMFTSDGGTPPLWRLA